MPSEEQREQELKYVITVVRALVTSTKPPVSLRSIERDYKNVEEEPIPFKRLGYRDALDMLLDTNAFVFNKSGNDVIISAKPNPKTAHIESMVRYQKDSKSKGSFTRPAAAAVRQNVRPVAYKPNHCAQQQQQQQQHQRQLQQQQQQQQHQRQLQQQQQQQQHQRQLQQQHQQQKKQQQQHQPNLEKELQILRQRQEAHQQKDQELKRLMLELQQQQHQRQLQQQHQQQKKQQQQHQPNLEKELQILRNDILAQRQRQEAQQQKDRELKSLQLELQQEQHKQKLLLKEQEQIVDKKIAQLQKQHELDLKAQALTIEKLQQELQKQQLKQEALLQNSLEQEQKSKQLKTETITDSSPLEYVEGQKSQFKVEELDKKPLPEKQKCKQINTNLPSSSLPSSNQTLTPPRDSPKSVEMNGNAAGGGGGAATSRKPHLRPILGNSAPQRMPAMKQPMTDPMPAGGGNRQQRQQHPRVAYPGVRSTGSVSVNYRLKQQQTAAAVATAAPSLASPLAAADSPIMTPPDSPETASSNKTTQKKQLTMPPRQSSVNFKFDPAYDAISSLNQYCVAMGYAPPEYECTRVHQSNMLHCKVRIGGNIYTSYPKEHPDEAKAKQFTSEIAIERLKELESRKRLSMLSDSEFLDGLYQELIKHPHGIVSHKLPEWYEATVKRQVPTDWWTLLKTSTQIRIESSVNTHIVFANTPDTGTEMVAGAGQRQKAEMNTMPELVLPWVDGQQDWSMYITHCDNTMHVWARLIDQSANFEKLTEQLNAHMSLPQNRQPVPKEPIEQQIYLVEVSENWNRVRVMAVDVEQRQCICHFVDFGDEVLFGFDVLYMCAPLFLALPPQAVCLSMYALDKFEEHPHALPVLAKVLAGHSVVTRIITSEAQFLKLGGRTQGILLDHKGSDEESGGLQASLRRACIVGTFYDTSTAEDIHLNDLVANQIIRNTPAPMLKRDQKSNHVLVSHVNDAGDLMVQIPNDDLKFVQRSIDKIMRDSSEQHRVRYSDLLHDQFVCVCDESGDGVKQWYRGVLSPKPKSPEEEVFDVYYVDDGRLRKTHISNIYRLEANNLALAQFPPQALCVRLHDVPPIDNQMVGRLRGRLSPQTPVLLKVIEGANDKLPMVTIHARGQDGLYLCLNSAIRMEYEVQSTTRLEPFDDGGLQFSPSGQLIRRCSFSSTLSSHSSSSDQPTAVGIVSPPATPRKAAAAVLPLLKEYEAIPAVGAYFEVRVALSINPGHFAVQPYKCYNQLQRLMKDLQAHCKSSAAQTVLPTQLTIGQAYASPDNDGVYHRVSIRKIYDEMIHVRFVDVGDDGVVRCNQLLQLTPEFRELPMMALPAQLHGIQLAGIDWTQENCVRFRKLTLGLEFIGIVRRVDKLKDERRALSLELIDTSTPQDIKIHETLISEKHALPAP